MISFNLDGLRPTKGSGLALCQIHVQMMQPPKPILNIPDPEWIERLCCGNWVWLPKQKCYAQIRFPYLPPNPGLYVGKIGLAQVWGVMFEKDNWGTGHIEEWLINLDGTGLDGKPLIIPCENNLPDDPPDLSHPDVRRIMGLVLKLTRRVEQLETELRAHLNWPF